MEIAHRTTSAGVLAYPPQVAHIEYTNTVTVHDTKQKPADLKTLCFRPPAEWENTTNATASKPSAASWCVSIDVAMTKAPTGQSFGKRAAIAAAETTSVALTM